MKRRARVVLVVMIVVAGMVGMSPSPAAAKATKKGYCKYIRKHQLEFVRIFGIETSVDVATEISDKELAGLQRVAPGGVRKDYKTFRAFVQTIASHDSDAIAAAAPGAGQAAQRIIDYTQNNCGSSLPPVSGTTATTEQIEL
ncbi:MAG: hypothetical protein EXQ79_08585 [Acidimicrobiia bacterium]|nr:hypothetical protein [Acidimicrobiia bacterium]